MMTSRKRQAVGVLAGMVLTGGLLPAGTAAGAASGPAAALAPLVVPLGSPHQYGEEHRYAGVPIPIGINGLTVLYPTGTGSADCRLVGPDDLMILWSIDPPLNDRAVLSNWSGTEITAGNYALICDLPRGQDRWELIASGPPAASATVSAVEPTHLVAIRELLAYQLGPIAPGPGRQIVFTTSAGPLPVGKIQGEIYDFDDIWESDGQVAADGLSATVTMPDDPRFGDYVQNWQRTWWVDWQITGPAQLVNGIQVSQRHAWGNLISAPLAPTTVKVAVSSTTATSLQQVKAIVQVSGPTQAGRGSLTRRGAIVVEVDGVRVKSSTMYLDMNGRWVVSLPKLKRGDHVVTAEYSGWTFLAGSTSNRALVRILI